MKNLLWIAPLLFIGCGSEPELPKRRPVPNRPIPSPKKPAPVPKPRKPWGECGASVEAKVNGKSMDGEEIACDLPGRYHQKNTGGSDGAGLCVYASARHSGRWQHDALFEAVFDWMKNHPGGSYPEKFDRTVKQCAKELGLPVPAYIQIENNDLDILKLACRTGRMPGVTYSFSPTGRYGGKRISHMVSLVSASDGYFVILDNNYPGDDKYEWLTPEEFLKTYSGGSRGWSVILLEPSPPPPPKGKVHRA